MIKVQEIRVLALTACALLASGAEAQSSKLTTTAVQGMSVLDYHQLRTEAQAAQSARDYRRAAELYARVAEAYPLDGENWTRLGRNRLNMGDYAGALAPLKRGVALGFGWQGDLYTGFTQNAKVQIAWLHMRLGERDSALVWLRSGVVDERYGQPTFLLRDSSFVALWQDPEFLAITGKREMSLSRDDGWRRDIAYLADRMRHYNALYRYGNLPDSIQSFALRLAADVPKLSDVQIILGMHRMLALLGQGHNMIYTWEPGPAAIPTIPIDFIQFQEGLYVTAAAPEFQQLVGTRVLAFNGVTPDDVLKKADPYFGNDHSANPLGGGRFFRWPSALHAIGIGKHPDRVELTLTDNEGKTRKVTVATANWNSPSKIAPPPNAKAAVPLWLSNPDAVFWTQQVAETTLYAQVNNMVNARGESLAQFGLRLRAELDSSKVTNLILDIRRNNGGNTYFYRELLRTLIAFDARPNTQLYVLTDRPTYSAAANFTTEVDRLTDALFVGVPPGGVPIQIGGDAAEIVLPYSGIKAGLTTVVFQYTSPRDTRAFVAPDIPVPLKAADYFANRDTAMEIVMALIGS